MIDNTVKNLLLAISTLVLSVVFMFLFGETMCFVCGGRDGRGAPPEIWHWCFIIAVSVAAAYIVSKLPGRLIRRTQAKRNHSE